MRLIPFILAALFFMKAAFPVYAEEPDGRETFELLVNGLNFPSYVTPVPDGSGRILIVEHNLDQIRVIKNNQLLPDIFLDLSGPRDPVPQAEKEGVVGLAFPPGFPEKRRVYVTYVTPKNTFVFSRFQVAEDLSQAILASEEILIETEKWGIFHHCGDMAFHPKDGLLYLCIGDSDRSENAQDLNYLQGKLLRLDVESGQKPYRIPPDNPFVGKEGARPEIWAYGLRNPWKFSFDSRTGELFIPDPGLSHWEELNIQPSSSEGGENYGWEPYEGNMCRKDCAGKKVEWPLFDYPNGETSCAIVGGEVYYGEKYKAWQGIYVFSDFCGGQFYALMDWNGDPQIRTIGETGMNTTFIQTDLDGELLFSVKEGGIYRLHFPENFQEEWKPLNEFILKRMIADRRGEHYLLGAAQIVRLKKAESHLEKIKKSKRWRWTQPFVDIFNFFRGGAKTAQED